MRPTPAVDAAWANDAGQASVPLGEARPPGHGMDEVVGHVAPGEGVGRRIPLSATSATYDLDVVHVGMNPEGSRTSAWTVEPVGHESRDEIRAHEPWPRRTTARQPGHGRRRSRSSARHEEVPADRWGGVVHRLQPAVGEVDRPGAVGVAPGHAQGLGGEGQRLVEAVEQAGHLGHRRGQRQRRAGPAGPTGNPVRYQPACLRNWRVPSSSPNRPHSRSRWTSIIEQISPRPGGAGTGWPRKAAARSRNSQGRPRQPRPTTTPSHPVAAIMARASDASHRSPLPRTGMEVTACLQAADGVPVGRARVELLGRAGVQGHRGHPFGLGDAARTRGR